MTRKLERQVAKRDPDAVGHFLLAWFHHVQGNQNKAIAEALKAKTYAPGSPLMEHLHYFLLHPEQFEAKIPQSGKKGRKVLVQGSRTAQILDLDRLIELLEAVESQRVNYSYEEVSDEDLSEDSSDVAEIISETLAKIHEAQGNKKEAIHMYERLVIVNEEKADTYTSKIEELKSNQ
jgi:tetratricopeptide (TPR) repeat protein